MSAETLPLLRAWVLNPNDHTYGQGVTNLIEQERNTRIEVGVDTSLRVKVIDACGMTCVFCHNEGTPVAADVRRRAKGDSDSLKLSQRVSVFSNTNGVDFIPERMEVEPSLTMALESLKSWFALDEIHLTGGEPTLNKDLSKIVGEATSLGYVVKMTSNGESGAKHMKVLAEAGLVKVNFSIFGTTPAELASVQNTRFSDEDTAARKITALKRSVTAALENNIEAAANVVVSDDTHIPRIQRILDEYEPQLQLRLLPDLDKGAELYFAIYKFLADIGATPLRVLVEAGSSNARVDYRLPDGRQVSYKQIRAVRLPQSCIGCAFNSDDLCKEGYYGLRLYKDTDKIYRVGVCIQRMDLTKSVDEIIAGTIPTEVDTLKQSELEQLHKIAAKREQNG